MGEESVDVVVVDGDECVVGLTEPEEDGFAVGESRKCVLLLINL